MNIMKKNKPLAVWTYENTEVINRSNTFRGHIIECRDLDSGDEFCVEVMINESIPELQLHEACERAAKKNEIVQMLSGNTIEFEYWGESGRVLEEEVIKLRTEHSTRTDEANELLEHHKIN